MKLRIAVYNVEWMVNLFTRDGQPKATGDEEKAMADFKKAAKLDDEDAQAYLEAVD